MKRAGIFRRVAVVLAWLAFLGQSLAEAAVPPTLGQAPCGESRMQGMSTSTDCPHCRRSGEAEHCLGAQHCGALNLIMPATVPLFEFADRPLEIFFFPLPRITRLALAPPLRPPAA